MLPNLNVRCHCPIGPRLAPLTDMTVCVCDFNNFGAWCMEASLFTMVASAPSQSNVDSVKLEYCSNRFIISSLLVGSCVDYLL